MNKIFLFLVLGFWTNQAFSQMPDADSLRKAEIDKTFWNEVSRAVKKGDFEGTKPRVRKMLYWLPLPEKINNLIP